MIVVGSPGTGAEVSGSAGLPSIFVSLIELNFGSTASERSSAHLRPVARTHRSFVLPAGNVEGSVCWEVVTLVGTDQGTVTVSNSCGAI